MSKVLPQLIHRVSFLFVRNGPPWRITREADSALRLLGFVHARSVTAHERLSHGFDHSDNMPQVDSLIQVMASFSQQTGLTRDQAIDQRPQEVQTVLWRQASSEKT